MRIDFLENTPGEEKVVGGVLKKVGEAVGVVLGPSRIDDEALHCELLYLHPGLIAGLYDLRDGVQVRIPSSMCGTIEHRGVTLEVVNG